MAPRKLGPALLAGIVIGVFSALPLVNLGNCCCLWLVSGGALAAYLLQQDVPVPITAGDGAQVGLLAGILGTAVYALVSIPIGAATGPLLRGIADRALRGVRDLPPEMWEGFGGLGRGPEAAVALAWWMMLGAGVGMIGGLIGAVLFRRPPAPSPPEPRGWVPPPEPPAV